MPGADNVIPEFVPDGVLSIIRGRDHHRHFSIDARVGLRYRKSVNVRIETNLLRRAVGGLTNSWQTLIRRGDPLASVQPDLPERDADRIRTAIDACLRASGGEVSARARAA